MDPMGIYGYLPWIFMDIYYGYMDITMGYNMYITITMDIFTMDITMDFTMDIYNKSPMILPPNDPPGSSQAIPPALSWICRSTGCRRMPRISSVAWWWRIRMRGWAAVTFENWRRSLRNGGC